MAMNTDVLIIGAGPAGMTAGLYAARAGAKVIVLEKETPGGQIVFSPKVDNYPALPHVSGSDFAENLQNQLEESGAELRYEEAQKIERQEISWKVWTDAEEYEAPSVIIAAGTMHRRLGLVGEEDLTGAGVSYCAVCDGPFYHGQDVAVVGGGDTALQDALFLSGICRTVTLIHRREGFRGEKALQDQVREKKNIVLKMSCVPEAFLSEDGTLTGLTIRRKTDGAQENLPVSAVFVAVGSDPQTEAFSALLGAEGAAYLPAGEDGSTHLPGLFVAGDCRVKGLRQLATAIGDGACAGMAAARYAEGQK